MTSLKCYTRALTSLLRMFFSIILLQSYTFDNAPSTLANIHDFIRRQTTRKFISKMWTYGGDMDVIKRFNTQLDNALSLFQVRLVFAYSSSVFPLT